MFHSSKAISLQIQFRKHAVLKRVINVPQLSHCFQQGGQNTTVKFNIPKGGKKSCLQPTVWKSLLHTELLQSSLFQEQQPQLQGAIHRAAVKHLGGVSLMSGHLGCANQNLRSEPPLMSLSFTLPGRRPALSLMESSREIIFVGDCRRQCYYSAVTGKCGISGGILSGQSEREKSYALYFFFFSLAFSHFCFIHKNTVQAVDAEIINWTYWIWKVISEALNVFVMGWRDTVRWLYVQRKHTFPSHPR